MFVQWCRCVVVMSVKLSGVYYTNAVKIPQRTRSVDYLNFEEKRQIIASTLSLSDLLNTSNSKAPSKFKAKKTNGTTLRFGGLGSGSRTPPIDRKSRFSALGRLFKPWKWKRKKKSDKFEAASRSLERKISVRANREELVQKGILLPDSFTSPLSDSLADELKEKLEHANGNLSSSSTAAGSPQPPSSRPNPPPPAPAERPTSLPTVGPPPVSGCGDSSAPSPSPRLPPPGGRPAMVLSQLPDPPIPVSEIGPIPPPPMFSSPSPMSHHHQVTAPPDEGGRGDCDLQDATLDLSDQQYDDLEEEEEVIIDDDEGMFRVGQPHPHIDTTIVEEVPAREPCLDARPKKSALKKNANKPPLALKQDQNSTRPVGFGGFALPSYSAATNSENKENAQPPADNDSDSDGADGPILYRDDEDDDEKTDAESRLASKVARKDSLALKLSLRPDMQELIDRNIIHVQSEKERIDTREGVGAKLIRRLSLRPTVEELEDRNILKTTTPEEDKLQMEQKRQMLLRKLSFRPTIEELKERKIIKFNDYIEVTNAHDYDRRADKPWTRLTPKDKAAIRKELNEFKSQEMEVHEDSRHLTRFHRP